MAQPSQPKEETKDLCPELHPEVRLPWDLEPADHLVLPDRTLAEGLREGCP